MPVILWGQTLDRFLAAEDLTRWGLMNAATNVLWYAEKPTTETYAHNEAASTALVRYAHSPDPKN